MVLIIIAVCMLILGGTLSRTYTVSTLNDRNSQFNLGLNAADSAVEKVIARMRYDYINNADAGVNSSLTNGTYKVMVPTSGENAYWGNFQFSDAQGHPSQTYVAIVSNRTYAVLTGTYAGLSGYRTVYRIVSNVTQPNSHYPSMVNAVQEDVESDSIPIFQFAIFYNGLMEYTWCAPLTVGGLVFANGQIYTGSSADVEFQGAVAATMDITSPAWAGHTVGQYTGSVSYDAGSKVGQPTLVLPIATNTPNAVQTILQEPPASEDPNSPLGQQRLANLAPINLLITSTNVTAVIQVSINGQVPGADPSPITLTYTNTPASLKTNLPFLTTTNTFTDQRENNKTVLVAQIDVGKYASWLSTNASVLAKYPAASSNYPTLLYVANDTPYNSTQLPAVRLNNGTSLPYNGGAGFTVATPDPLYVWGNYNCTNSAYLATTNTSATVPAALMCDALTILSSAWLDSQSASSYNGRNPAVDTVNAAVLAGIVLSDTNHAGVPFSGGVMNFPRLLEDWANGSGVDLWMNTSIINMFASTMATNIFQNPGAYYTAPTRHFFYNTSFLSRQPPGCPNVNVISRVSWAQVPPNTVNYNVIP